MINNNNLYDVEKLAGQPVVVIDGTAFPVSVATGGTSGGGSMEFYKCAAVDTSAKTWSGYKAVLADGVYSFEEAGTEGLSYTIITPEVDGIYSADALITVSYVYAGMPEAYLDLPLSTDYNGTLNGVTTDFSSGVVGSLSFTDGALNFPGGGSYLNLPGVTTDLLQGDFTIFMMVNQAVDGRTGFLAGQSDCFIGVDDNNGVFNLWAGNGGSWNILQADYLGQENSGGGSIQRVLGEDAYITITHEGLSWKLYVNGELSVSKLRAGEIGTGMGLRLGLWGNGSFNLHGKISNVKLFREALPLPLIQKLIESANKPDAPGTGGDESGTDDYPEVDQKTLLYLPMYGSQPFTDLSANKYSVTNNNVTVDSTQTPPSGGSGAAVFNGSSAYLTNQTKSLVAGLTEFTIEFDYKLNSTPTGNEYHNSYYFFSAGPSYADPGTDMFIGSSGITVSPDYYTYRKSVAYVPDTGVWHTLKVTRNSSGIIYVYIDSSLIGTIEDSDAFVTDANWCIGRCEPVGEETGYFNGYMANYRVSNVFEGESSPDTGDKTYVYTVSGFMPTESRGTFEGTYYAIPRPDDASSEIPTTHKIYKNDSGGYMVCCSTRWSGWCLTDSIVGELGSVAYAQGTSDLTEPPTSSEKTWYNTFDNSLLTVEKHIADVGEDNGSAGDSDSGGTPVFKVTGADISEINGDYSVVTPDNVDACWDTSKPIYSNGTIYFAFTSNWWNGWTIVRDVSVSPFIDGNPTQIDYCMGGLPNPWDTDNGMGGYTNPLEFTLY